MRDLLINDLRALWYNFIRNSYSSKLWPMLIACILFLNFEVNICNKSVLACATSADQFCAMFGLTDLLNYVETFRSMHENSTEVMFVLLTQLALVQFSMFLLGQWTGATDRSNTPSKIKWFCKSSRVQCTTKQFTKQLSTMPLQKMIEM